MTGVMGHAEIRFYGDLATLAGTDESGTVAVPVERPRSVKDAIESCGVPHTEVDLLLVRGRSVGFDELVVAGDRVAAYPPWVALDVPSRVRPAPLDQDRFVLDVHLGRLAQHLRLLGFDTLYRNDLDDEDLAALAAGGPRWLLTRDRGLLMRRTVTHGYLVRSSDPSEQVLEVVRRFGLADRFDPCTRCARCNGLLAPVDKADVVHLLEEGTRREHDEFSRCADCGQLYWPGTHVDAIARFLDRARSA